MAGYMLIEKKMLQPHKADGIVPNASELGFIDYLRELRQEAFPFQRGSKLRLVGFENVLLDAQDRQQIAADVHGLLAGRANELDQMGGFVQVVFDFRRRRKIFRQRPFKRIVPQSGHNAAESLFDFARASQKIFAARKHLVRIFQFARFPKQFIVWNEI